MKKIRFITPTKLSLLDITTMGDSIKRGNDNLIGTFDSGLKYAIAILLRNNVNINIDVFGNKEDRGEWEETFTETFNFTTYTDSDHKRDKELIQINCSNTYHGGSSYSQHNIQEPTMSEEYVVKTAFAKNLGFDWKLWMALREIYSNMLDEGGYYSEDNVEIDEGTVITLSFSENEPFNEVWENRNKYILEGKQESEDIGRGVYVFSSPDNKLRIYKNNILVYEDETISRFNFNITFGDIDERRILRDLYSVEIGLKDAIRYTNNEKFLKSIITSDFECNTEEFLANASSYGTSSDLIHNIAEKVEKEFGRVSSYKWLMQTIRSRKDCKISGKKIETIQDSLWAYSKDVTIITPPKDIDVSLKDLIQKQYDFKIDKKIKITELKGSNVIADRFEDCIIVSPKFDIEKDFGDFIVQYLTLTEEGNIIDVMSRYIKKLIKKQ